MRSGFGGGFQSGGGTGRCRLVPSPMDPGCWRTRPDVSACAASSALAPPRIRVMRSRRRRASSKSRALAAASILRRRSSILSFIANQRAAADFGGIAPMPAISGASALAGIRRPGRCSLAIGVRDQKVDFWDKVFGQLSGRQSSRSAGPRSGLEASAPFEVIGLTRTTRRNRPLRQVREREASARGAGLSERHLEATAA